ncbi:secretoglobin family 3A member 1 isoform X1 [Phascolarctos cinereus]|uniref:Secretoglobin family 3A member 1 isoform X1 n=1 Tax=Phascolarctos cinereus TaxID=38626 RepID=A0A6P5LF81_PHACI|nr:secretoglobin family 3A member 1 isoform X1 [Phascolarctos cinereus]
MGGAGALYISEEHRESPAEAARRVADRTQPALLSSMKLTMVFLLALLAVCSSSALCSAAFAFFKDFLAKPPIQPTEIQNSVVKPVVESVPNPIFSNFSLLRLILRSLGIPVDHLIEGSKKCVKELGSESVEALKTLLGALTYYG